MSKIPTTDEAMHALAANPGAAAAFDAAAKTEAPGCARREAVVHALAAMRAKLAEHAAQTELLAAHRAKIRALEAARRAMPAPSPATRATPAPAPAPAARPYKAEPTPALVRALKLSNVTDTEKLAIRAELAERGVTLLATGYSTPIS